MTIQEQVRKPEPLPVFEEDASTKSRPTPVTSVLLSETSHAAEQFRLLASRVGALGRGRQLRTIGVVSASAGEGKTTVAIGLARSLALGGRTRVLLAEADLRRPALDATLGLPPPSIGVLRYLERGESSLRIRKVDTAEGCWLLSAGAGALRRPDILASPRMTALLEAATRSFAYVVLDCPPLIQVSDAVLLQDQIDGFVFVVRSRHAPREAVHRALSLLKPGAVLGVVFNGHQEIVKSYYNYGYDDDYYAPRGNEPKRLRSRRPV